MTAHRPIVVGVAPGQVDSIASVAVDLATRFDHELVCVAVDPSRYTTVDDAEHSVSRPIDPDSYGRTDPLDPDLVAHVRDLAAPAAVTVRFEIADGDPASELARVAAEVDAALIVVGTHEASFRQTVKEFVGGSVATHLVHHQHRPVVVVPLTPVGLDHSLPWDTKGIQPST